MILLLIVAFNNNYSLALH